MQYLFIDEDLAVSVCTEQDVCAEACGSFLRTKVYFADDFAAAVLVEQLIDNEWVPVA